jgi:hypothetical protein
MANEPEASAAGQWERIASELRACREQQQRTWGDVDPLTLGRYLSDEVSGEERRQIEQALDELPELRRLTDLVRDVLGEGEAAQTPAPATLPLRPRPAARPWRLRRYAALAAAACLLLALGVALPRLGAPEREHADSVALALAHPADASASTRPEFELAQLVREADDLQQLGRFEESLKKVDRAQVLLARAPLPQKDRTDACDQLGLTAQKAGDWDRSERLLQWSYSCRKRSCCDADDPAPRKAAVPLAKAYEYALNLDRETPGNTPDADHKVSAAGAAAEQVRWREDQVRRTALVLRERIARQDAAALQQVVVPALMDAVQSPDATVADRVRCIAALGRLGVAAGPRVEDVLRTALQKDQPSEVRAAAEAALGRLEKARRK